jgi:hypothetical protein
MISPHFCLGTIMFIHKQIIEIENNVSCTTDGKRRKKSDIGTRGNNLYVPQTLYEMIFSINQKIQVIMMHTSAKETCFLCTVSCSNIFLANIKVWVAHFYNLMHRHYKNTQNRTGSIWTIRYCILPLYLNNKPIFYEKK